MRHIIICISFILLTINFLYAQNSYFPPNTGDTWETIDPSTLGWCVHKIDSLYSFLEDGNTKAFIILKDGKIVLEQYFNGHDADKNWQWASAGKTLTAFSIGLLQEEGLLNINDKTADYLGQNWTNCTNAEENEITILHQLTMTTGIDDSDDPYCTDPACLNCLTSPNSRWAYHNGPYTPLMDVMEAATGSTYNQILNSRLKDRIGMQGLSVKLGYNRIYYSTARSMARFGLLMLNQGVWQTDTIMKDRDYYNAQINTSQVLNNAYGYLWWLNGKDNYLLPGLQFQFQGAITPNAPQDMFAGIGKSAQYLCVIPSQNIIVIRMGNNPGGSLVPTTFMNDMWEHINNLYCSNSSIFPLKNTQISLKTYPNPSVSELNYAFSDGNNYAYARLFSLEGKLFFEGQVNGKIEAPNGINGLCILHVVREDKEFRKMVFFKD